MELGKVLTPLEPHKSKLNFIKGLYNAEALKGNIHSSQTGNLLSGAPLASGGKINSGTSVDQMVAQRIGHQTKVSSLVLGCMSCRRMPDHQHSVLTWVAGSPRPPQGTPGYPRVPSAKSCLCAYMPSSSPRKNRGGSWDNYNNFTVAIIRFISNLNLIAKLILLSQ